ncbi:MAG: hypothetical protein U0930_00050 [Pirellulales bacterium]
MLQDYPTTKSSRRCSLTGAEFAPGESYISVLIPEGDEITRMDISAKQWAQPPENAIGWWKCRMPDAQRRGSRPAPNSVLLDMLAELLQRPDKAQLAYLLAVLLVRRRVLVDEQKIELDENQSPQEFWNLVQPADGRQWQVPICNPSAPELAKLQESLIKLLFTDE